MKIEAKNLGVISEAKLEIKENTVNIKYGINGLGKSTIAKGIELAVKNNGDLSDLRQYGSEIDPKIQCDSEISDVLIFNQEYVNKYLFKDDIANNSFEIMINTDEYKLGKKRIDEMFLNLVTSINKASIETVINELDNFVNSVSIKSKSSKNGVITYKLSKSTKLAKAKSVSNIEALLDERAKEYQHKLKLENNHEWLKWFEAGRSFIEGDKCCPFCLLPLPENFEDKMTAVKESVNATNLKQNVEIKDIISKASKYMTNENENAVKEMISNNAEFSERELEDLYVISTFYTNELSKLKALRYLNISKIKQKYEDNTLVEFFYQTLLEERVYDRVSAEIKEDIVNINKSIRSIVNKAEELKEITKEFSDKVNEIVKTNEEHINAFFKIAGIPYNIKIIDEESNYKTILVPTEAKDKVTADKLSYGEQNVISLILFSLEAKNVDGLIILDDPVSSFDNNKKYAILYYLFAKDDAVFRNKTVILFTHDFDVIIDCCFKEELWKLKKDFSFAFLKNEKGILVEKRIKRDNIENTLRMWQKKVEKKENHPLIRVVNLRKYIQYTTPKEKTAIDILSSLEHNNLKPMERRNGERIEITDCSKLEEGKKIIQRFITDFDYDVYLRSLQNKTELKRLYEMSSSAVEKLQILRMLVNLTETTVENKILWDYLTEYYHYENNEMMSLDESKYDLVPNYIMIMADEIIKQIMK